MSAAVTLFQLASDGLELFDGSVMGAPVTPSPGTTVSRTASGVSLSGGMVDVGRHPDLDGLQSFTVDTLVTTGPLGGDRQNIAEGQTPPFALFIDPAGKLVGQVNTPTGWASVDSGATLMTAGAQQRVVFIRDANGQLSLQIDGVQVGTGGGPGPLQSLGDHGVRIGMGLDGRSFPFQGGIAEFSIRQGVATPQMFADRAREGLRLEQAVRDAGFLKNISVLLIPDDSHARLQHIKDLMNAAGVAALSDLDTLPVRQATPLGRGQILVAPNKSSRPALDWGAMVAGFRAANGSAQRAALATHLPNRNSAPFLQGVLSRATPAPAAAARAPLGMAGQRLAAGGLVRGAATAGPAADAGASPLRAIDPLRAVGDLTSVTDNRVTHVDPGLIASLVADRPSQWPILGGDTAKVLTLRTVPLDSAVVIAGTLDLTNEQLVVEPNVDTLYIIAETVICGPGAAITWRRPGGSTPGAADNPDLDGRNFHGIQTKPDSRDGLDGGAGQPGGSGATGASGGNGPNIEMWVKSMTGLPNLDFNGEDGIAGGAGQRGGQGGRGGNGNWGKRFWTFVWYCVSDPGDGGNGGDGGAGGDGGRGGDGGKGGAIKIGVLTGTLASTVVNQTFKLKNQGGRAGAGGPGGAGGSGGAGGRSGNAEQCDSAKDGHPGAQGQPGADGPAGFNNGADAQVTFFEFTQAAWDDQMTRPWITQITPTDAFPGDTLTIHGSRFTAADQASVGGVILPLTINPDQSASVILPMTLGGGTQSVFVRRSDGVEGNRVNLGIKPQLDVLAGALAPAATVTLTGHAFLPGASVLLDGGNIAAVVVSATELNFPVPGTGGGGSAGGTVSVQVRNPDGRVSNTRSATQPRILEVPFRYGQHNLSFPNFGVGLPDWGTYEDTFGAVEVMHELLDPVFGDPVLTIAYYEFYKYFLKGKDGGGLATGFCTSLASLVADRFWLGRTDTPTIQLTDVQKMLTGVHGKLLSRQSLLTFHDQGRQGNARVERTFHEIEATFLNGTDRQNAPLLFFIPAGEVWDSGYQDKLSNSHCIMPYRFVYPDGAPAPQLTADGSSTLTDPDGVELYCWDCNKPTSPNCRLRFRRTGGEILFDYFPDQANPEFTSEMGITLGMMRHGQYMLADHDLPFNGPFGLGAFVIEFLLSPADLEVTDAGGLRTGNFGGKLRAEIPGSHLAYLMTGLYLLPPSTALTRTIVGNGAGTYDYTSITPDGASIVFQGVPTQAGHRDVVSMSADATQIRFAPAADKTFAVTIARKVGGQARAVAVSGLAAAPGAEVDITLSPDLSVLTLGNRGASRTVEVRAFSVIAGGTAVNKALTGVALPTANDLAVTVADWNALDLQAQAVPFQ